MKATGIVRHVDELGRIVLPMGLRNTLDFNKRDQLEIYVDRDLIVLEKYQPSCIFCGSDEGVIVHKKKLICSNCVKMLAKK